MSSTSSSVLVPRAEYARARRSASARWSPSRRAISIAFALMIAAPFVISAVGEHADKGRQQADS